MTSVLRDLELQLKGGACVGRLFGDALSSAPLLFQFLFVLLLFAPSWRTSGAGCFALRGRRCVMYCDKCRRQLYYKDPSNHGWCFTCGKVVDITDSKISFWHLMAVFTMLWAVQV